MRVALFSTHAFEEPFLRDANEQYGHDLRLLQANLDINTAALADGFPVVSLFVSDRADRAVLEQLAAGGTRLLALRSAGFNHVDVASAEALGLTVLRVPAYSPYAVAEHTVGLILTLNRRLHRAIARVREGNFALDGLLGFDLHGRTVGVIGTGRIGTVVARIMRGFGCEVLAHDVVESDECRGLGVRYAPLAELAQRSDIITLHCPLTPATHHLVNDAFLENTRTGVMLVNTSRGGLIDTRAVIQGLKSGRIGSLAIDVYEEEESLFFRDLSDTVIQDDVFARLLTFPNVVITAHQAFFTREALQGIASTTLRNITDFAAGNPPAENRVTSERIRG